MAWDPGKLALRTFHLARFSALSLGELLPANVAGRAAAVEAFMNAGFGLWRVDAPSIEVTVRIFGAAAEVVSRQIWHRAQRDQLTRPSADQPEACLERSFPVSGYEEILSRILSFGSKAEVLAPQDLRERWQSEIHEMARRAGV